MQDKILFRLCGDIENFRRGYFFLRLRMCRENKTA